MFVEEIQLQYKEKYQKRAKRKFLNAPLMNHLIALDSPLKKAYWTTVYCSSMVRNQDGKSSTRYCKRPWCKICNPIRVAVRLNNYKEQLEGMGDLLITTLTIPNVEGGKIRKSIQNFRKVFRQYRDSYRKREGKDFRGVYNFEITYNATRQSYHPHIHIIHELIPIHQKDIEDKKLKGQDEFYNDLILYWLKKVPEARMVAQDTRLCTDLIEGFKYATKSIFTVRIDGKKVPVIPVRELDQMYQELKGVRLFQPFGIRRISDEVEEKQMEELTAYETDKPDGVYRWAGYDWFNIYDNNIALCDYIPDEKTVRHYEIIDRNIYYNSG